MMSRRWAAVGTLAVLLAGATAGQGAAPAKVFTDPAKAGPDFAIQGEYAGSIAAGQGERKAGVQIIALGDGKFRAVGYAGGLPGAGWDKSETVSAEGQLHDGAVVFHSAQENMTGIAQGGKLTVKQGDKTLGTLAKVERKSPTLGAQPPAGAVVLFDGTSADKFQDGRVTADGLLMEGVTSKQKFQSFTIHVEFRTPFQPLDRGQGRGNSGFYAQGRYEVQILDSFGLKGEDNECGGIYRVGRPAVNMCFPPLSWQTYDVDFTAAEYRDGKKVRNARMTVRHNGVLIHEAIEIPGATVAAPVRDGGEPGPIYLQNHGNPVRFRNIWVMEKK